MSQLGGNETIFFSRLLFWLLLFGFWIAPAIQGKRGVCLFMSVKCQSMNYDCFKFISFYTAVQLCYSFLYMKTI